jgi:hypothetical protein
MRRRMAQHGLGVDQDSENLWIMILRISSRKWIKIVRIPGS